MQSTMTNSFWEGSFNLNAKERSNIETGVKAFNIWMKDSDNLKYTIVILSWFSGWKRTGRRTNHNLTTPTTARIALRSVLSFSGRYPYSFYQSTTAIWRHQLTSCCRIRFELQSIEIRDETLWAPVPRHREHDQMKRSIMSVTLTMG